jgi:hypothetical protein
VPDVLILQKDTEMYNITGSTMLADTISVFLWNLVEFPKAQTSATESLLSCFCKCMLPKLRQGTGCTRARRGNLENADP